MKFLAKLSVVPVFFLAACAEYEASNFVGFDNGAQVYQVPVRYNELLSSREQQNGFNYQISPYCPNGYREISRTPAVFIDQNSGGFFGAAYVPPSRNMETLMTFACVGAPAVIETR